MGQSRAPLPDTNSPILMGSPNITPSVTTLHAAIPASVILHDKNAVGISGPKLAELLAVLHRAGVGYVEVVMVADGQTLLVECRITVRNDKQRARVKLWLYPLQPAQSLLRDLYYKYRGEAPPRAKRPMPVLILSVKPR